MKFIRPKGITLKPCPFCGAAAKIGVQSSLVYTGLTGSRGGTQRYYHVGCHVPECEIKPKVTRSYRDKQQAFDLWNRRA